MKFNYFSKSLVITSLLSLASLVKLYGQDYALEFDGIDDYIQMNVDSVPYFNESTEWTAEVIFELAELKNHVLLSQTNPQDSTDFFLLGIDANGRPYTLIRNEEYVGKTNLSQGECYHLSVVYSIDDISFYLNGSFLNSESRLTLPPDLWNYAPFIFGRHLPDPSISFFGRMEEFRIFLDARTPQEIFNFTFTSLTLENDNLLTCFDFSSHYKSQTYSAFNNHVIGELGGGNPDYEPSPTEDQCVTEPLLESIAPAPFCNISIFPWPTWGIPNCNANGLAGNDLLCNGNFEQFCQFLYLSHPWWQSASSFPNWLKAHHAFAKHTTSLAYAGSDVINWVAPRLPQQIQGFTRQTPDFFVRNGIGSPNGFNIVLQNLWGQNVFTTGNSPSNTWNGLGDAVAGISANEGLMTRLNTSLVSNMNYTFSGWFYNTNPDGYPTALSSFPVKLVFENSNGNTFTTNVFSIPHTSTAVGNNGWVYSTFSFSTPANIPAGYDRLTIQGNITNNGNLAAKHYLFLDDLRLVSHPGQFPQYVNGGDDNDLHHRRVKVDSDDNVYVLITVETVSNAGTPTTISFGSPSYDSFSNVNEIGSLLVKYDDEGKFLWRKFYPHLAIVDFTFDSNDNIVATGFTEAGQVWPNLNYVGLNVVQSYNCWDGTTETFESHKSEQVLILRASKVDGSMTMNHIVGGTAHERGIGIHVINNVAFIPMDIYPIGACPLQYNPSTGQVIMPNLPVNSGLFWDGGFIYESAVIKFDLNTNLEAPKLINYVPKDVQLAKGSGSNIFILRGDGNLDKLNITGTSASSFSVANAPIPLEPTYMQPSYDNSNVFIAYNDPNLLELRNFSNLNLVNSFSTQKLPLSIASGPSGDYVLYRQDPNGTTNHKVLGVEKLDLSNFGTPIWSKESSGSQAATINLLKTRRFAVNSDIAPFQIQNNELGIISSFSTSANPWMTSFDSKTVSGTNQGMGNCVILKLTDAGSLGYFKNGSNTSNSINETIEQITIDCNLFPNPNDGQFIIETKETIEMIEVFELNGKGVLSFKGNNSKQQALDLRSLPKGLFVIKVYAKHSLLNKLVLIE